MNRVWILGAGFSRSLGGPLLNDLLSESGIARVHAYYNPPRFPEIRDKYAGTAAGIFWQCGPKYAASVRQTDYHVETWRDAEHFLDALDAAVHEEIDDAALRFFISTSVRANTSIKVEDLTGADLRNVAVAARRLVAAQCCQFLEGQSVKRETWQPYIRWARQLTDEDTIITFNYDRVLEILAEVDDVEISISTGVRSTGGCRVFKLHGSVDWKRGPDGSYERTRNPCFALAAAPDEIAIATPGPTKIETAKKLQPLWNAAIRAIEGCSQIFFLGYRFPPSDAYAKETLLTAIRKRGNSVSVRVVLGPDTNSPDARRTIRLTQTFDAVDALGPVALPLFAEDFMTIYNAND